MTYASLEISHLKLAVRAAHRVLGATDGKDKVKRMEVINTRSTAETIRPDATARFGRRQEALRATQAAVMTAVADILNEKNVSSLTIRETAERAGISQHVLSTKWPTRLALTFAFLRARSDQQPDLDHAFSADKKIYEITRHLINQINGIFGRIVGDLIAEGQHDPAILRELVSQHLNYHRECILQEIQRGIMNGLFSGETNAEIACDLIVSPIYYRLMLRQLPIQSAYGDELVRVVLGSLCS